MLIVDDIPANTPRGARIFVSGNFNYWDPGDANFELKKLDKKRYGILLPEGWGTLEYKFTRGDWTTVEEDECGSYILNRIMFYGAADTLFTKIKSWEDIGPLNCSRVVIRVTVPPNTDTLSSIYISGNFNNWRANDNKYLLHKVEASLYELVMEKPQDAIEFKFTRGSWKAEELDDYGNKIANRTFIFGKEDTLKFKIPYWKDQSIKTRNFITLIVKGPKNQIGTDQIYLAGNFNNWTANDSTYRMRRIIDGLYSFQLFRNKNGPTEFKFTRGHWNTVECDKEGRSVENRVINVGLRDTVTLNVSQWLDRVQK